MVLRGLTLTGLGGQNGINVTSVGNLHVEGCVISGFTGYGIYVSLTADGSHIFVKDTITRNNGARHLHPDEHRDSEGFDRQLPLGAQRRQRLLCFPATRE